MACDRLPDNTNIIIEKINKKILSSSDDINEILNEIKDESKFGIIAGEVQSGKTKFMIHLAKKAFLEFNYDKVIVLSGNTNNLHDQTFNRFKEEEIGITIHESFNENNRSIDIVLKENTNIVKLKNGIQRSDKFNNILLIDDESDYASINTDKKEATAIHKNIQEIYRCIKKYNQKISIILLTATPYANLLNKNWEHNELKFVYSLKSPDKYTGLDYFNDKENFYIDWDGLYRDKNIEKIFEILNIKLNVDFKKQIGPSFCIWLLKTAALFSFTKEKKSDFLVYLSDSKEKHDVYKCFIESRLLRKFKDKIKNFQNRDLLISNLLEIKNQYFKNLNIDKKKLTNFVEEINDEKIRFQNIKFNSDEDKRIDSDSDNNDSKMLRIIIGGKYLSRGFTYKNLIVELFDYISKDEPCCDTLLQRCRWFGYREDISEYMNVITTREIIDYLQEAKKYNDVFFKDINHKYSKLDRVVVEEELEKINEQSQLKATSKPKES